MKYLVLFIKEINSIDIRQTSFILDITLMFISMSQNEIISWFLITQY